MITLSDKQTEILHIIKDTTLTHEQTMMALAKAAENTLDYPDAPADFYDLQEKGIICDMGEGHAPYAPRYILPDYEKFFAQGSKFLRLNPPKDLYEAVSDLLILYHHVPSVTHFPVYIGCIDKLLDPFITDEAAAKPIIKNFLRQIDRTVTDSFCHGNIGPEDTRAGRIILECERELQDSTPNLTLLYNPEKTSDEFAVLCTETALDCAKPSFAYDPQFASEFPTPYGIASCYNGLPIGGGAYTLSRLMLNKLVETAASKKDFFERALPHAVETMCKFMDCKIRFLVEETPFFTCNFLVKEGLLHRDRFNGLFGMVGMNECVNGLMKLEGRDDRFGYSEDADNLGLEILTAIDKQVKEHKNPYCEYWNGSFILHAQVGLADDQNVTPGTRIPIGEELPLYEHMRQAGKFHKFFPSGTGDIFPFDMTSAGNPEAVLDVIKGGFKVGMRYISTYSSDSDVIRITGYLVKRSDIEALEQGRQVVNDTVVLGMGAKKNCHVYERKVRSL